MKNYKLHTSEGVRDYLGYELLLKEEIENRIKKLFLNYGYELVKTPTFEYIDLYSNNGIQHPSLYNLINREGEVLALRNDMTKSIARIVATKGNIIFPKKYCYIDSTFRYPRLYQGKSHEFTQAGIEIVGSNSLKSDIECIRMAYQALQDININDYMIHIGCSPFIEGLLKEFNLSNERVINILSIIENKDYVSLKNILLEYDLSIDKIDLIIELTHQAGKLNFLQKIIDKLEGYESVNLLNNLKDIYKELSKRGLENKMVFDFSIYSYAKYYTGITFQIFKDGIGRAIVTGGRCNELLSSFGLNEPLIGFGLDVDACLEYILNNDLIKIENIRYISHICDDSHEFAHKNNKMLQDKGIIVDVSMFDDLEETIKYAKAINCKKILHYYENNVIEILVE